MATRETRVTWAQVLGRRLERGLLDPPSTGSVRDVVGRSGAVPAWPDAAAEWGVGARRASGRSGDAAAALAAGEVVKVFAFRGAMHLMTPEDAGRYLVVRASNRQWERANWQSYYDLSPADWPRFRDYAHAALADGALTHAELLTALRRSSRYRHLADILASGNDTLLKPLSWQGVLGFGPPRDGETTYLALDTVTGWGGVPDLEEAGPALLLHHLGVHGPTTAERLQVWFGQGLGAGRRALGQWLAGLSDRLVSVQIEGASALARSEDVEGLLTATPSDAVRLLPGRDPWLMAAGTDDAQIVPPARRALFSRTANPVVAGGVVAGSWAVRGSDLAVGWFGERGAVPTSALEGAVCEHSRWLGRDLRLAVTVD